MLRKVLVIHGFNSAPGQKSKDLAAALPGYKIISPELSSDPKQALEQLTQIISNESNLHIVGTSLGGFYSLVLAEMAKDREDVFVYAINPSYRPSKFFAGLENKVYVNYKTGKEFKATPDTINEIVSFLEDKEEKVKQGVGLSNINYYIGNNDEVIDHLELIQELTNLKAPYRLAESDQDHRHSDLSKVVEAIKANSTLAF